MTTTQQLLDERYGRTRRRGRTRALWAIVAVVALALVGWLSWSVVSRSASTVDPTDLGFEVTDSASVEVSFQFSAPADRTVVCIVSALDEEFGTVGWKVFEYPPEGDHAQRHTEQVPTVAEATTGLVNSCWVA